MTDDPLWRFALDLYARPGIAPALLVLQDDAGADVTLLIFLLWCAETGRPLDDASVAAADGRLAPWRAEVVEPLRRVRRSLKAGLLPDLDTDRYRERVKAVELEAERLALATLSGMAPAVARRDEDASRRVLAIYAAHLGRTLPQAAVQALVERTAVPRPVRP